MLASLRKASNSTPIKILFGVLALLFIVWGVGTVGGQRVDIVAKVHGDTITRRDVDVAAANIRRQYEEMLKGQLAGNLFKNFDFQGQALDQLIDDALMRHEAARLGITVSDDELVAAVQSMPAFQENGRFNRDLVQRYLQYQRDRGEFESQIRRGILFQRIQGLITDGVQVADAEVEDRYRTDHEKVNLAFVRFASAELAKEVQPSEEDLQHHLEAHAQSYREPVRVRARYVAYKPADFAAEVQVSDAEIAEQYELHKEDRYSEPEQVRARHILVELKPGADDAAKAAARKKAEDIRAKAKAPGADFAALAKKSSDDKATAPKGGDLGLFPRGRMAPAFEESAFALQVGEVSDVVESPFGFHVIEVEEHRQAGPKPLDDVREEIRRGLVNERALKLARQQAEEDRRRVVQSRSFTDALAGRKVVETPPFAENADVPGVGRVPEFSQAAFGLRAGDVSDLIETEEAVPTIYLLSPFDRVEAHVPPLDEIRARVTEDARRERAAALAKERAEALLASAKDGGLEKAAGAAGRPVEETGAFERTGAVPKLGAAPRDLRTDGFALTPEAPLAQKVYTVGPDAVVVALKSREAADMSGFEGAKNALHDTLLQQQRQRVLAAYMDFLKQRAQSEGALEVRVDALPRGRGAAS